MKEPHLILGIGELLWDLLPDGPRLGGAPANFAVMAGRLGSHAAILSRIGRDDLGRQAVDRLDPMPVDTGLLQIDAAHRTGRVTVSFSNGEPEYVIHQPAAWDFMQLSDDWLQVVERAAAICFGTLAQRNLESRQTIQKLVSECPASCIRIFDANLRAPFYSSEVLEESLELATVLKLNDAEAPLILELLDLNIEGGPAGGVARPSTLHPGGEEPRTALASPRMAAERLLDEFPSLQLVAITKGSRGSLLVTRDEWNEHPGFPVKLADGIGAGDAFTAAMTHYLLRGADLATLNEAGNRWGGWMASQSGAMPAMPDAVRDAIAAAIEQTS
jgi:fructokinase